MKSQRILCIGLVCGDIINLVHSYPQEDTDQRVAEQWWQLGGNAANTATVLCLLGADVEFMGTMAIAPELPFLKGIFEKNGINIEHCSFHKDCNTPMSVVIVNKQNGSRTILHSNKNLPEVSYEDFTKIDFQSSLYHWIHFEGRPNVGKLRTMLQYIEDLNKTKPGNKIITSVELEKKNPELEELTAYADYVFISKEHAQFNGFENKEDAVNGFLERCKEGATVICAWGEDGAAGRTSGGEMEKSPVFPPSRVIDTLGAGDTFNAGVLYALNKGKPLKEALTFGCRVAGVKVGLRGLDGIKEWATQNPS